MSLFSTVEQAPPDPILGVTEKYLADKRPAKVNLGVGVYQDASGRLPLMRCVEIAEQRLAEDPKPRGYLPIDGLASYTADVRELVFGADSPLISQGRVVTVQALGGTGGLKLGADFLRQVDAVCCSGRPGGGRAGGCSPGPGSRCRRTAITTRPAGASISTGCWPI